MNIESIGQYHDLWSFVVCYAPDSFPSFDDKPVDQELTLVKVFQDLRDGFHFAERRIKGARITRIVKELMEMSFEAYSAGNAKEGAHILQECEGMIWPGRKLRVKYAVEAERRAFGANVLYKGVKISPYPYQGTSADLGTDQSKLLELAQRYCKKYQLLRKDFDYFAWVIDQHGIINRISQNPKEDDHEILGSPQKSWRATYNCLKKLAEEGRSKACVLMQIMTPLGNGLAVYDLEQYGRPRISARQSFTIGDDGHYKYSDVIFHLEDSQFFPELDQAQPSLSPAP